MVDGGGTCEVVLCSSYLFISYMLKVWMILAPCCGGGVLECMAVVYIHEM